MILIGVILSDLRVSTSKKGACAIHVSRLRAFC